MKRVLVTGGSGFIGRNLISALVSRGDAVSALSRTPQRAKTALDGHVHALGWDPEERGDWYAHLSGQDAVVHLAGEQAVGRRYTESLKQRIRDSRVKSSERIVEAIAEAAPRPSVLVCASGVDYYGAREPEIELDEAAPHGDTFLARLCVEWERATRAAEHHGVRVVNARFGIVLGPNGGALETLALPFRLFAGGPIGSGEQVVPWVHIDDAVAMLLLAIDDKQISGPVNVVSPHAVTNRELSRELARALGRPSWLPAPAFALKLALGSEGAEPILMGRRAVPGVMKKRGFAWRYPELAAALEQAFQRAPGA